MMKRLLMLMMVLVLTISCTASANEDYAKGLIQAANLNPPLAFIYNNLGVACEGLGDYDMTIEAFNKALDVDAKFSKAAENLERVLKKKYPTS